MARLALAVSLGLFAGTNAHAGAFLFSETNGTDLITHVPNYGGTGGNLVLDVCISPTTALPAGVTVTQFENTLLKVIRTWNRQRESTRNLSFNASNDIPSGTVDLESAMLHEMGHCLGLAHVNHASESALPDPQINGTKSNRGANAAFDQDSGADALHGSADDVRGDDVNLYWFRSGSNDPMAFPAIIDATTYTQSLAALPSGQLFPANADRSVLAALGYPNTESSMQQGQFFDEAQRRLTPEDLATIRLGRAGIDETQGTSDDYTFTLNYLGQTTSGCELNVSFDAGTSFAACGVGGQFIAAGHARIAGANLTFSPTAAWHLSQVENTTVAITSDTPDPSPVNTAYAVAVTVTETTDFTGSPPGSVIVSDGAATCTATLAAATATTSTGTCNLTSTTVGAKTLTAEYTGFEARDASLSPGVPHTVTSAGAIAPTVAITGDVPDPSVVGQAYAVSVSVTGSAGVATGTVNVSDGSASCAITLAAGLGNCNLTSTTAGTKTLTATYAGDANYTSGSDTESHVVNVATPTVTITSDSPDPSAVGQNYAVAVTVTGAGVTPTGTVNVSDGSANCAITLASGAGSCNLASTTKGAKTITASYAGNANYAAASDTEGHTVDGLASTTTITSDAPDPSTVGQAYAVAVTVTGSGAAPTGTVNVSDGSANCAITLAAGAGSCNLTSTTSGAKTLTATYAGNPTYDGSSDTEAHTVNAAGASPTTTTITSDTPDPSVVGLPYTVAVSVASGGGTPTGTVAISDGTASCNATLSSGAGQCALTGNTVGAVTITATYPGNASFAASADTEAHTVSKAAANVVITSDAPDPSAVGQGYVVAVSVGGAVPPATGTVTVSDGSASCTTGATAPRSCTLTSTTAGAKTLTATYAGDANYEAGSGTTSHTVTQPVDAVFEDGFE